tara:strand:- start:19 stop:966 length:948 start_codon:yes stop_codon:yes gene_type:complete
MSSKKIAVIGYGNWGKNHARVLNELNCLSGIYDEKYKNQSNDLPKNYKLFRNYEDLIENSDAAVISTPAVTHFEIAMNIVPHLDLLIEKPLSMNSAECSQILKKAKENNKIIQVGHQLHFHPAVIKMKELIHSGKIGNIKWIYSNRLNMGKIRDKENVLWSFAPHDISLMLSFTESKIEKIQIQGTQILNKGTEDTTLSMFKFKNNIEGHIFVSWFHPFKEQRFVVVGEKGTITFSDTELDKLKTYYTEVNEKNEILEHNKQIIDFENTEPLKNQAKYFLECLESRSVNLNSGQHGLEVIEVLEESSRLLNSINQ